MLTNLVVVCGEQRIGHLVDELKGCVVLAKRRGTAAVHADYVLVDACCERV